jgi:tetratricopeptide (TPR) repeat protein
LAGDGFGFFAYWWWVYFGLLFRAFGNRFAWRAAYQRAVNYFARAIQHSPENANLYFWRGTLYWRELGNNEQAEIDLSKAIELNPKLLRAYLNRAFVRWYDLPPRFAEAAEDLSLYVKHSEDPYWRAVAEEHLLRLQGGRQEGSE